MESCTQGIEGGAAEARESQSWVPTSCYMCSSECGLLARRRLDGKILLKGNPANPMGRPCAIAALSEKLRLSPSRVLYPLRRAGARGEGFFKRVSWDEALKSIAGSWSRLQEDYGSDCLTMLFGEKPDHDMAWDFAAMFGTPNIFDHNSLCDSSRRLGFSGVLGEGQERPLPDLLRPAFCQGQTRTRHDCRLLVLFGENPAEARRFRWLWDGMLQAQKEGMRLVVLDPFKTQTAKAADIWLPLRPGSDACVLLWLVRRAVESESAFGEDVRSFLSKHARSYRRLKGFLLRRRHDPRLKEEFFSLPWAAKASGIGQEQLRKLGDLLQRVHPSCVCVGMNGVSHSAGGFLASQAMAILCALLGSLDVPGGLLLREPIKLARPWSGLAKKLGVRWQCHKALFGGFCRASHGVVSKIPRDILEGAVLADGDFAGQRRYTKALFVLHGNPFLTAPESGLWKEAVTGKDRKGNYLLPSFVSCSSTLNETSRYADYVLPLAHFLERQGVVVQETPAPIVALRQKIAPPPSEVPSPLSFFRRLAKALWPERLLEGLLKYGDDDGWCDDVLSPLQGHFGEGQKPCQWLRDHGGMLFLPLRYKKYEEDGFATADGRMDFFPESFARLEAAMGLEESAPLYEERMREALGVFFERDAPPFNPTGLGGKVFRLVSGRSRWHVHSMTGELWPKGSVQMEQDVLMNEADAASLGVATGSLVFVRNSQGVRIKAKVRTSPDLVSGVLRGLHGFADSKGNDGRPHYNINALTSAKRTDRLTGNACFGDLWVVLDLVEG